MWEIPVLVGAITAIVEIFKRLGLSKNFALVASVILGIIVVSIANTAWGSIILTGALFGLASAGLFDGLKKIPGVNRILKVG